VGDKSYYIRLSDDELVMNAALETLQKGTVWQTLVKQTIRLQDQGFKSRT
jgi:hypothetical protein